MVNKIDEKQLSVLVDNALNGHDDSCNKELCDRKSNFDQTNIKDALRPGGKKATHQNRIPNRVLDKFEDILIKNKTVLFEKISKNNFREIINFLNSLSKNIKGIGELAVYDTSKRLALQNNINVDYVYLHAGALEGAKKLGLDIIKDESYLVLCKKQNKQFSSLSRLNDAEKETFLCIHKNDFENLILKSK
ncbi:hypothetical protein DY124_07610 [Apilactobacillus micheneri]|uniref:hypothetical protein n=1 Tax=Apilactobacillus micheneri TaxID=1899430 RepID=UPI00112697FA|nr:hypothetical protein [Apilactobacillus micheneri]TPR42363.1 hypothetical protein DY124_07610 [Apilactobacillus micheneri]TPR47083.1 hypothetical protein DY125_07535 [Apilactobacillus micheneri]